MTCELYNDDCLEKMKQFKDKSIDLILCDLPYGTTQNSWDSIIDLDLLWKQYERIIKDNGAILLFAQTPFDKVLGCSNLKLLRYEIIWQKTHPTGFLNARKMPLKAHENILVFYKKLPTYNPQKTEGHERKVAKKSSREKGIETTNEKILKGRNNYGKVSNNIRDYDSTERFPLSVQVFSRDTQKSKFHPTQKPVKLLQWLIKTYSNKGDIVLDNCMGSGSTGVACLNTQRNFIGIEKDKYYFDIASNRIKEVKKKYKLFDI